ncbi:MAG: hypothetical protein OXC40_05130 [Proteobacteria bacterium]|nr:hypothetical protein [Pseudomonadota bacterium]
MLPLLNNTTVLPWVFFVLSSLILIATPYLSSLSLKYEKESHVTKITINLALVLLVIYHILGESLKTSGVNVLIFTSYGFFMAMLMGFITHALRWKTWPFIPLIIGLFITLHGVFDGYAFQSTSNPSMWSLSLPATDTIAAAGLANFAMPHLTLAVACILHRIPESFYLWRMISNKFSHNTAIFALIALGLTTLLGIILSGEILSAGSSLDHSLSYSHGFHAFHIFIAGFILYETTEIWRNRKNNPS